MTGSPAGSPDVTIGIPTRNRCADLTMLLRRLDAIDDDLTYELIVVDEGSTDGTPDLLARWRPRRMRLTVVRHDPPRGPSAARNRALELASAPYIGWIDDDDLTSADRFRRQRAALRRTGYRWSAAARVNIDASNEVTGHAACPRVAPAHMLASLLRQNNLPAIGQGLLIETAFARELGGFDETLRYAEDWDFAIRAAQLDPRIAFVDEPLVGYRIVHEASLTADTDKMINGIRQVMRKHVAEYRRLGVRPASAELQAYMLPYDLRVSAEAGRRRAVAMARTQPSPRYLARAAAVSVAPRMYRRLGDRLRRRTVPRHWLHQAQEWLAMEPPALDLSAEAIREPIRTGV